MKRDLASMSNRHFDVVVIGGGIYGACVAWDAALRGLSVALVDKGDFGAATSANSQKIIHGGLRYLQHGDLRRMRESARERRRSCELRLISCILYLSCYLLTDTECAARWSWLRQ